MKTLVNAMAGAVRRFPWWVIGITLVVTFVLGAFSSQFTPDEDQNESFAPDAPELIAADRISELFGEDSQQSVMQIIISSESGDVITADGFAATQAVAETVTSGALSSYLSQPDPSQPPILSYLAPVEIAVSQGAPAPATDEQLKLTYSEALLQLPPEQAGFATGLLPTDVDAISAISPSGLMLVFTTGPASNDEFQAFADVSVVAAEEILAAELPPGFRAEPFSFELLFGDQDEFQAEIGRLFATAAFIIMLVLALVFLIRPRTGRDRLLTIAGGVVMLIAITILVLPGLAKIFPDTFPDALADIETGPVLGFAALSYLIVFLVWTFSSRGLRRTTADTLVTIVAIVFAITWMNGYGFLRFEQQGPMVQIIPILLIGLGVDYSIHMGSRYREEVSEGASVDEGVTRAIRTVGVALVLATVTTAVGFLTNVFNDIPALREFGELAAVGILASFILMLTFVPAIREILDRRGTRRQTLEPVMLKGGDSRWLPRFIGKASWLPRRAAVATVIASLILGGVGAYGVTELNTQFSFLDFVPTTSPLRGTFETLLEDYGGGFGETTQTIIEGDVGTAASWNGMVEANGNMADTENVLVFGGQPAAESPLSLFFSLASPDSPSFDPAVGQAAQAAGITATSFVVMPEADVAGLYDVMFVASPGEASRVIHVTDGTYDAALFTTQTQAGELGASQLREDLADVFAPVEAAGLTAVSTSDEIINDVIVTSLRDSQVSSLLLTLVAALLLLVVNFWFETRRPMLGVITTAPVVLVVLLAFGIMAGLGIPFGPVTATISALAIGIGIPYMIHITHRYQEDRARSSDENEAMQNTLVHTGGALAGSALTTVAGFGILVTSTTIPFRQFGFVTAYTILLALLAAVLILPSYLILWDRWHRRRGESPIDTARLEAALDEDLTSEPA